MNPNLSPLPVKASIIIWSFCCFCNPAPVPANLQSDPAQGGLNPYPTIGAIPVPSGFHRIPAADSSFAGWLRAVPLKKDRMVRLFDGSLKFNQGAQFAVLDVSVGHTDLQQCADAVMRLRAEFLYSYKDLRAIEFHTAQGTRLNFGEWAAGKRWKESGGRLVAYHTVRADSCDRACFWEYLQCVFAFCGTLSLEKQLDPVARDHEMRIGDVLIHGGSPGHAMLVVDMAADAAGRKIYMLAQGYMPAQDIHIVKNMNDSGISPWYSVDYDHPVYTPEYTFYPRQLRTWPAER